MPASVPSSHCLCPSRQRPQRHATGFCPGLLSTAVHQILLLEAAPYLSSTLLLYEPWCGRWPLWTSRGCSASQAVAARSLDQFQETPGEWWEPSLKCLEAQLTAIRRMESAGKCCQASRTPNPAYVEIFATATAIRYGYESQSSIHASHTRNSTHFVVMASLTRFSK